MPDIWLPLKEMTENLLPHLYFDKIDVSDRDRIECLWNVHEKNIKVDIDDLSSGEKAIIHLFFPLIEHRIQSLIEISKGEIGNTNIQPVNGTSLRTHGRTGTTSTSKFARKNPRLPCEILL